ncbi:low specificity L-threonine aldolase [Herbaspirillum sp. SJZ107]|uniref:threonine aldolase family protein n=1 Tax=Herbaspirillum sp. SJZ107 TaxID=2572881 RepID=UPI00116BEA79|nr:aminotransferase class I/II-fold pyridoxal phosphate-dependent enzyme [Herbaspirillum sp. SJZ107]TQK04819.1 L-threonine aldolase [Herbaspirillum sp. SJZ107]
MTLNRRGFLGAVPIASLALASSRTQAQYAAAPVAAAAPISDYDTLVQLSGDALPRNPMAEPARLQALLDKHAKPVDGYLAGGAVAELEAKFSALLGKEDTVFMPTGTLANHLALRLLCGEAKHALVQQESHVYRDESNTVTTLSGINLVPLAPGRAAPTLDEVGAAIERAEVGPYPIKVGAIALESPVRRAQGATLSPSLVADIARLARAKNIRLHLDGARLLLMSGMPGFGVQPYCAHFDTVYVSLYKYLGAPFGGVLSGPKPLMAKARELRHIFGGTIYHGWQAALPALDALDGVEARFASVRAAGDKLLAALERTSGFKVQRIDKGSNLVTLEIAPARLAGLEARLQQANVRIGKVNEGKVQLGFNESILRRDTAYLLKALAG